MKQVDFIGSVSCGTMRPEDLIPKFMDILIEYNVEVYNSFMSDPDFLIGYEENQGRLLDALLDELNDLSPDGYYFGSHPGDGSDYGYWRVEEDF